MGRERRHVDRLGREQYGYPINDESACPDGRGRFNHVRTMRVAGRPAASIYRTPATGAHEVGAAIRAKWAALGWQRSALGCPTTDEFGSGRERRSDFQRGLISWTRGGGARVNGAVLIDHGTDLNPVSG